MALRLKTNLERLLRGRPDGIFVNPFETGAIGPDLFRKACEFGLEGLVSKRSDRPFRGGRSKDWVKVKSRSHPGDGPRVLTAPKLPAFPQLRNIRNSETGWTPVCRVA
jgi:hypothetical protein